MGWGRGPVGRTIAWHAGDSGFRPQYIEGQVLQRTPVILALRRRQQEDRKFKVILGKFQANLGYVKLCLKKRGNVEF